jgi:hypothetical protein
MRSLQRAGGVSAIVAAATYLFAMGLAATVLSPMVDPTRGFPDSMAFLLANRSLVSVWHFVMYLVNGLCLTVLVLALFERLKGSSPRRAQIGSALGLIWTVFVFLSGLITIYGNESLISLYGRNPGQAESLKTVLDTIALGIDSSDKLLGGLWIGLVSLAAFRNRAFPRAVSIFGMVIGAAGLVGTAVPALVSFSYVFGVGAIAWWLAVGITLLRKQDVA